MKVLIENAVPLNNGDAALIFSVGDSLEKIGANVYYSTFNLDKAIEKYPQKKWLRSSLDSKLIKVPFIGFILLAVKMYISKKSQNFDAIISAPGGYINSYYGFKRKVQLIYLYKKIHKTNTYMYSQSVGPLNFKDQKVMKKYIKYFDIFYVRDDISMSRMTDLNINQNVVQTKDAAFLLGTINKLKTNNKKIAISVREWKHDSRNEYDYMNLIKNITYYFIKKGYEVTFLSTCQGENTYTNDSDFARKIFNELSNDVRSQVIVDSRYYNLYELREELTKFDFTIGTRLHMCILSWLSGTPALNISYEEKGKECYKYLNLEDYTIDYNFTGDIEKILTDFIETKNWVPVFEEIKKINIESQEYFTDLVEDIANDNSAVSS